jgi:hypothetical protein
MTKVLHFGCKISKGYTVHRCKWVDNIKVYRLSLQSIDGIFEDGSELLVYIQADNSLTN